VRTEIYSTDLEIAARYKISRQTLWNWVRKGRFPAPVKLGANTTRWRQSDVEQYEAQAGAARPAQ
jgi:prophage regulatory protein